MLTMYAPAWQQLPGCVVEHVLRTSDAALEQGSGALGSHLRDGDVRCPDDAGPQRTRGASYGLRQTDTWLSLSDVNSRRSQSA